MSLERTRRRALRTLSGLGAAALGACAVAPIGLKAPEAKLSEVAFGRGAAGEVVLLATLDVRNPNAVDIPLSNVRFELDLFGRAFGEGRAVRSAVTLPAQATVSVPIEFSVPAQRIPEMLREVRAGTDGRVPYRLRGSASWGASVVPLSFERSGEVDPARGLRDALRLPKRP